MNDKIMEYVERARNDYRDIENTPVRYRNNGKRDIAIAKLVQIECLAIDLELIETGTI